MKPSVLAWVALAAAVPAFARSGERSFRIEQTYRVPAAAGGAERRLFVPLPPDDAWQSVRDLRIEGASSREVRDPDYGNRAALIEVPPSGVTLEVSFVVTRRERGADLSAARDGAIPAEVRRRLEDARLVQVDARVRRIAADVTRAQATPLEKARAIYDYVLAHMKYEKKGVGWGHGSIVWACDRHYGNCTDFHSLLIGLLHAAGIPARFEIGDPVPETSSGAIPGYHCWADFWVNGSGWVPVDASEAWRNPSRRDYFFGRIDADRFALSMGRDLTFPGMEGPPLNYFVNPYLEVGGRPADTVAASTRFAELPPPAPQSGRR